MENEVLNEPGFAEEITELLRSDLSDSELKELLQDYHENDIAESLESLEPEERIALYKRLGAKEIADIISYMDEPKEYAAEMEITFLSAVMNAMESDEAVDLWDELEDEIKEQLKPLLDEELKADIRLIISYEDDEIGSLITTNYICIRQDIGVREATNELIRQAGDNDNISTIYVVDSDNKYCGVIGLKDLIIARASVDMDSLISFSYPYLLDHDKIADNIERIKDYAEDSLPVLNADHEIIGIITAQDVIEAVDDEMGEDYAKLAGLTAEEDLRETTAESMKKRLPWLIILLFLGMGVSTVVGVFEGVVSVLPIVICFQSLILDMAGNVGTQSLAVTIRVLMDENLSGMDKVKLVIKEIKVGFSNGLLLGLMALIFLGLYIYIGKGYTPAESFLISACVGAALLLAMIISSLVGTLIPMFFHRIKVDPAVASGPLITTVNDLVAVVTYYGLAWLLLINMLHLV